MKIKSLVCLLLMVQRIACKFEQVAIGKYCAGNERHKCPALNNVIYQDFCIADFFEA
ncbi:MAG: hypothetical protein ABIM97_13625 [Ginsengibacter sp.]